MDPLQAQINLEADLGRIADNIESERWIIEMWPDKAPGFYVTMSSDIDRESYTLKLGCEMYPDMAPSIRCVLPATKEHDDRKAWPNCDGFRPPPQSDLCLNISREALTQVHPNWQQDPRLAWDPAGNPIWRVLAAIQDRLNDPQKYHGRHK